MLEPIGQNVILEIISRGEEYAAGVKSRSGLIVQADKIKQNEPNQGRVYAVSAAIKDPEYSVGDLVIYSTRDIFQGFEFDGKKLVTMKADEIIAKLSEEAA